MRYKNKETKEIQGEERERQRRPEEDVYLEKQCYSLNNCNKGEKSGKGCLVEFI